MPEPDNNISRQTGQVGFELLREQSNLRALWLRRIVAFAIDALLVSAFLSVLVTFLALPSFLVSGGLNVLVGFWSSWFGGLTPVFIFLYFVLAESFLGTTLGKRIMGLKIATFDGYMPGPFSSFVRNLSKLHWIILALDVAAGLGSYGDGRQKFSDKHAGTRVVESMNRVSW